MSIENYNPRNDGLALWQKDEVTSETNMQQAFTDLVMLLHGPKKSIPQELKEWRKLGRKLEKALPLMSDLNDALSSQVNQVVENSSLNKYKRWTPEEDELLIESIANGDSVMKVASVFGRTPQAISARVSVLVGIKKVSKEVAGRFLGTINGVETAGAIKGTVFID